MRMTLIFPLLTICTLVLAQACSGGNADNKEEPKTIHEMDKKEMMPAIHIDSLIIRVEEEKLVQEEDKRCFPVCKNVNELLDTYFAASRDRDIELLYHLMTASFRRKMAFRKFRKSLEADYEKNGGLDKYEKLALELDNGTETIWSLQLKYGLKSVPPRTARVTIRKEGDGLYIDSQGLLPLSAQSF